MAWEITAINLLRQDIYRVTAVEKDAQSELTGESVSTEHNTKTGYPALQAELLDLILEKQQKITDKESLLETYKINVSLAEAVDITGGN